MPGTICPKHLLAAIAATLAAALPGSALADTLVDNINGIAVGREGKVTRFAGMVIDDQGRITQILKRRDKPPENVEYHEDGRGRTVIPGFVDAHVQLMDLGLASLSLDLSGTSSLQEAQARLAAYAQAFPDRPWIVGRGWDQARWGLNRFPNLVELDAVLAGRPVWLVHADGQAGWANSAALAAAGLTPRGKTSDNSPSGILTGTAMELVTRHIPPPRPEDRDLALHNAQQVLIASGVTALADMGTSIEDWMTFRRAGDDGRLQLRIMAYADSAATMLLVGGSGPTRWLYDDRLRLNGLHLRLDGALGSRGALLNAPYADAPSQRGFAWLNGTQLRNLISRAAMDNFQVAIDATGDAATAEALAAIEELGADFGGDRRWRIENAAMVSPDNWPRFGQHGVIASMQPRRLSTDWQLLEARLGPDRLAGLHAWRSLTETGAMLAFGSGAPALAPNGLAAIAAAISREDAGDQPFGGWMPGQTITREQALSAYTANAAYAGFAEGRFGSLKAGERADFLVLNRDPLLSNPADLRAIRVLETWIGGRKVYQAEQQAKPPLDGEIIPAR